MVNILRAGKSLLTIIVSLFLLTSIALAATIKAEVDRAEISENQSFHLYLTSDGTMQGSPDLSPLEEKFIILNHNHTTQMSYINGQSSARSEWDITLIPKLTGTITVPSVTIGKDKSKPFTIRVTPVAKGKDKSHKNEHVFIKVSASTTKPYIGSQVLYIVKLYYDVTIQNASLTEPGAKNAEIHRVGESLRYQERLNGHQYQVTELRYLIIPKQSGKLTITAPSMIGHVPAVNNSFANLDPFFASPGRAIRVVADKLSLEVMPIPANVDPNNWLPTPALTLKESWAPNPPKFEVGEPVTRTITIKAKGLKSTQLPNIPLDSNQDLKVYPDKPKYKDNSDSTSFVGTSKQKFAIIPMKSGKIKLPAIKIEWWNTKTKKQQVATLPARTIHVTGVATTTNNQATSPVAISPPAVATANKETHDRLLPTDTWEDLAIVFFIAWISTVGAWIWQVMRSPNEDEDAQTETDMRTLDEKAALKELKAACLAHDATDARSALLHWACQHWADDTITSTADIIKRLPNKALAQQLDLLAHCLYAPSQREWNGKGLWEKLALALKQEKSKQESTATQALPELYPHKA